MKLTHRQRSLLFAAALWGIFVAAQVHHAIAHDKTQDRAQDTHAAP